MLQKHLQTCMFHVEYLKKKLKWIYVLFAGLHLPHLNIPYDVFDSILIQSLVWFFLFSANFEGDQNIVEPRTREHYRHQVRWEKT